MGLEVQMIPGKVCIVIMNEYQKQNYAVSICMLEY